ncbi:MAG: phosphoribosylamine/glycine ligase [Ignavibacteria bacterium]|nr:phosphoribosylamine/glycine ligase [Ignavibacteria bacterium]
MNVLLLGSGGREHALARTLAGSPGINNFYASPGNPGIFHSAKRADIDSNNFYEVATFCKEQLIDLVVVGPELPLADGIVDFLAACGIPAFGPTKQAAQLESSKKFAKDFMQCYSIPTAKYNSFEATQVKDAHDYVEQTGSPIVIKADGLAAGKGVIVALNLEEAHLAINEIFGGMFGKSGERIVIEEFLEGEEASILAITDGKDFITLASAQDHKRIFDGDEGKNTGGMGAYSPAPIVTQQLLARIEKEIIAPTIQGMSMDGMPFVGCLYAGLMICKDGPKVIEFNVRFGDPEIQAVLAVFRGDFAGLLYSAAIGKLDKSKISNIAEGFACCVVLASKGYPDSYAKGFPIEGISNAESGGAIVFQAGTAMKENILITSGGRVLGVTGIGNSLKAAIDSAYKAVDSIHFENSYYRKDIGTKGLK